MHPRQPQRMGPQNAGFDFGPPAPTALWVLLGVIFFTFTLSFFESTRVWITLLRLTPAVWQAGFVWQLFTYPFMGFGRPDFWFLLQLFMLFWFGRDTYYRAGGKRFWRLLLVGTVVAGVVATLVDLGLSAQGAFPLRQSFVLLQGQQALMIVLVAAFATLNRYATIYVFFVLPVQARWFLPLEILLGFLGFLWSKDLGGFLGLCTAVAVTWWQIAGSIGSPRQGLRNARLRLEQSLIKARLGWLRRRRGIKVVGGGNGKVRPDDGKVRPDDGKVRPDDGKVRPDDGKVRPDDKVRKGPWVN